MGRGARVPSLVMASAVIVGSLLGSPLAGAQTAVPKAASATRTTAQEAGAGSRPAACAKAQRPTVVRCYLAEQPGVAPAVGSDAATSCPVDESAGYTACNIQNAYGLTSLSKKKGKGNTVAVVDAYDDPNAESDLGMYRSTNLLSDCTTANGCFEKVNQEGVQGDYPDPDAGWAQEISLDLDMVSAVCPNCHIILVEANSSGLGDLGASVDEAVALGARVVTDSWGSGEFNGETGYDGDFDHPGVAITFSSGDGAYQGGVQYPSASPYVTSVGGTELTPKGTGWTRSTWVNTSSNPPTQGSGSGCSAYEPKPYWQTDKSCPNRMTADVSAVAANVLGYDTYDGSGWYYFFGTSVSSPIIAAAYGLANNPWSIAIPASAAYTAPATSRHDITTGSTGTCTPPKGDAYFCKARTGYDGPTGLGEPNGIRAFKVPGSPPPAISGVSFSGSVSDPTVTVSGSGFGSYPPFGIPAGCSTTGDDYGTGGLFFEDTSVGWGAGEDGDCIGIIVGTWSSTSVTYSFGSGYTVYGTLADGDGYTAEVQGATFNGTVTGLTS